jgi:hypothetical protein
MPSFVPVEKIPGINEKSGLGYMCDSLVVIGQLVVPLFPIDSQTPYLFHPRSHEGSYMVIIPLLEPLPSLELR